MKLENQVASLELCEKLKELGVKQVLKNGDWAWVGDKLHLAHNDNGTNWFLGNDYTTFFPLENEDTESHYYNKPSEYCKAFTVAELGEMLPYEINLYCLMSFKTKRYWSCRYENLQGDELVDVDIEDITATTEADARAKMLIYLLENNLLT